MGQVENKKHVTCFRITDSEQRLLRKKAKRAGLSVSGYVRSATVYGDCPITVIDTKPLVRLNWELTKHGTNLNQMVEFFNTYGEKAYDAGEVSRVLDKEMDTFGKVGEALVSLRREAEAHHVIIDLDTPEYDGKE